MPAGEEPIAALAGAAEGGGGAFGVFGEGGGEGFGVEGAVVVPAEGGAVYLVGAEGGFVAVAAVDSGHVINPDGIRNQIEGGIVQTISRTLLEELQFDRTHITSVDWASYPILRFPDVPRIHISLINRPDEPSWGAGEMAPTVVPAAISNAVFDATALRLRSVPFLPGKVQKAQSV